MTKIYDTIIIGVGPGGLTSALYASRANLDVLVLGMELGGQLMDTDIVENYTGVGEITGAELADKMYADSLRYGAEHIMDMVATVKVEGNLKRVYTVLGEVYEAKTIIIATGTEYNALGVAGETDFSGKGVSNCFTCDAAFFKDKRVAVVGGGDSAVEGAIYLTQFTDDVVLIHRRDELRSEPINQDRLKANDSIKVLWNTTVMTIKGETNVEGLLLHDEVSGLIYSKKVDGLFVAIGSKPQLSYLDHLGVDINDGGYIRVNEYMETNVEGVYAVGDVNNTPLKQISTAVGDGSIAGQQIYEYLN